jgi:hypothetical protein
MERLEKLKTDLTAARTIDFDQDNNSNALIPKIFINGGSTDFFDRTIGDIQILENGRVAVHGQMQQNAAVHGRGEYSSGQYRLRFKIEQWNGNGEFSCGIVSKNNTPLESLSHTFTNYKMKMCLSNSHGGFSAQNNNNLFYFTGRNYNNQKYDIVELFIDCDQRIISLTNEQTRDKQQLNVNLTICPFPWQFFITLLYANDRVRLC